MSTVKEKLALPIIKGCCQNGEIIELADIILMYSSIFRPTVIRIMPGKDDTSPWRLQMTICKGLFDELEIQEDDLWFDMCEIEQHTSALLITRLKIMSNLSIVEHRVPQMGSIKIVPIAGRDNKTSGPLSCALVYQFATRIDGQGNECGWMSIV